MAYKTLLRTFNWLVDQTYETSRIPKERAGVTLRHEGSGSDLASKIHDVTEWLDASARNGKLR
jgi:hypothetical protein